MRHATEIMVIVLVVLGAGLLLVSLSVLVATGIGWLLSRFLPFSLFETTLLSMIGLLPVGYFILQVVAPASILATAGEEDDDEQEDDNEWEEDDELEDEEQDKKDYPAIPRWRQPIKRADRFANTRPDDRCPCGSGRKYKNCHGGGRAE